MPDFNIIKLDRLVVFLKNIPSTKQPSFVQNATAFESYVTKRNLMPDLNIELGQTLTPQLGGVGTIEY